MSKIAHGFATNSTNSTAAIDVGGSSSRPASGASISSASIHPARTLDAAAPVITTKNATTGKPIAAASRRFPPQRIKIMPNRMLTCIPLTATA